MKIYRLKTKQFLPVTLERAWDFFTSPRNLALITPKRQNFEILSISGGEKMFRGQVILYKITVLPFVRMYWETEITEVIQLQSFTDIQRKGPYARWAHKHTFAEVKGGIEMYDELEYVVPYGPIGVIANYLFVEREVKSIFKYRSKVLEEHFNRKN